MESSTSNTSNLQSTTYVQNPNISESVQPVSQPTVTTVDMTNVENPAVQPATQTEPTVKPKGFDSDNLPVPTNYIKKFMSGLDTKDFFKTSADGFILYNFNTEIFKKPEGIKDSYIKQIGRDESNRKAYNDARELFIGLDSQNYRYMQHPTLGKMRIAIDENGKDIGLPEAINETGNPFQFEDPKNIPTSLV